MSRPYPTYQGRHSPGPEMFFWERAAKKVGGCWQWQGYKTPSGYGSFMTWKQVNGYWESRSHIAHRYAYERVMGPIPAGMELDHLCRNKLCVNPAHLEIVTPQENKLRARKEVCKRGHALIPENLMPLRHDGRRRCRICARERSRGYARIRRQHAKES